MHGQHSNLFQDKPLWRSKKELFQFCVSIKDQPFMCIYLNKLNPNIHDSQDLKLNFFKLDCCSLQGANLEKPEVFSCSCFQSKYTRKFQEKCLVKVLPYKKSVGILWKDHWNITLSRPGMEIEVQYPWNNTECLKLIMNGYGFLANMEIVIKPAWIEKWFEWAQNLSAVFPLTALNVGTAL